MNEIEHNFMFQLAEERGIEPLAAFESLHFNGRQIYVHFMEDQTGIIEAPNGVDEGDDTMTYQIRAGMIKPLAPDSRVELADALGKKLEKKELNIRVPLDDSESKYLGNSYIKAIVDLKSELVIDYKDSQFLTSPQKSEHLPIRGKRKPHTAFAEYIKTEKGIIKPGDAWRMIGQYADQSRGDNHVNLPGWGLIYLKRDREKKDKLLYKTTIFEGQSDGDSFTKVAFCRAWEKVKLH
jgi:hypothetical protein